MMTLYLRGPFSRSFRQTYLTSDGGVCQLPVDLHADDESFVLTANVPGLKAEDVKIEILDDVVTLRGEIAMPENGNGRYLMQERSYGKFERSLRLPDPADAKKAEAKIENGLLTLRIPKAEEARPRVIKVIAK